MTGHPNTIATGIFGGLGTLTAYLLNKYAGTHITVVQAGGIATGYAAVVLFVGRRGIKATVTGIWTGVWNGSTKPEPPPPEPAA